MVRRTAQAALCRAPWERRTAERSAPCVYRSRAAWRRRTAKSSLYRAPDRKRPANLLAHDKCRLSGSACWHVPIKLVFEVGTSLIPSYTHYFLAIRLTCKQRFSKSMDRINDKLLAMDGIYCWCTCTDTITGKIRAPPARRTQVSHRPTFFLFLNYFRVRWSQIESRRKESSRIEFQCCILINVLRFSTLYNFSVHPATILQILELHFKCVNSLLLDQPNVAKC
jgi:hypothetical protein